MKTKIIFSLAIFSAIIFNSCYVEEAPHADVHVDEIYESYLVVHEDFWEHGIHYCEEYHLLQLEIEFENMGNRVAHDVMATIQIYDIYGGFHEYDIHLGDIHPYEDVWYNFTSDLDESVIEEYEVFVDWCD